ncbi:MAG: FAD-dependent oxidoreductase [Pseudomonadota bacterium]
MRVAVIGAGVVGVLSAYYLRQLNCEVTVYERDPTAGSGTSFANGGQLSYSFTDAMADPQLLARLPGILANRDPAFQITPSFSRSFLTWGLSFMRNCTPRRRDENTRTLVRLALRSQTLMETFATRYAPAFSLNRAGKLVLLDQPPNTELLRRVALKQAMGVDLRVVTREEIDSLEPSIRAWSQPPEAGLYSVSDAVADSLTFTRALARDLQQQEVQCWFGNPVLALQQIPDIGWQVVSQDHTETYDAVLLCTGAAAAPLLAPLGIRVPVLPMAGYSVTLPRTVRSPAVSITALAQRTVFSPLGEQIRIAGFADINPGATQCRQRINNMLDTCRQLAPEAADYSAQEQSGWMGYRPMTPNSLPIVGPTQHQGLFTNLGHGMLGWTLAAATGEQIAAQISSGQH